MAKEGEVDTGAAGIDKEMVEISSMEFTMAIVIAEAWGIGSCHAWGGGEVGGLAKVGLSD